MKNRILDKFPATQIDILNCPSIFIADFTERTDSKRAVEVTNFMPKCPRNQENDMDVMQVENLSLFAVAFATFNDHSFKDIVGGDEQHTEGAFFVDDENSFFALYEIKDCKLKNIYLYKQEIKDKMRCSSKVMRVNEIISDNKVVLGLVSFPRKNKGSFNGYFNNDPLEMKRIVKEDKINFFCSNSFSIIKHSNLVAIYE